MSENTDRNGNVLKECPFCGSAPVMRQTVEEYAAEYDYPAGEFPAWFTIHCDECGIEKGEEYRSDAIAAWNRRHHPTSQEREPSA